MTAANEELITDLENILKEVAKVRQIDNYILTPNSNVNVGDGFVSQFCTGEVKNRDTNDVVNVAIKKVPKLGLDYSPMYKNEDKFFTEIFPSLDALQKAAKISEPFSNIPTFFCSSLETKKQFIALENLNPFGYIMHDKKAYLDKEHLEFIFKTYGKFHALSFVLRKQNLEKYEEIHKDLIDIYSVLAKSVANPFKAALGAALEVLNVDAPVRKDLQIVLDNPKDNFINASRYEGKHKCSTHGDCWSNNMLFKYNKKSGKLEDIKLIDFQLVRNGTPIHDLSYFFYSGASRNDINNLEYYLKLYHNSLSDFMKQLGENASEIFPFDTLIKEWKDNALLGIFMGIYLWQLKLTPKEEFKDILTSTGKSEEELTQAFLILMDKVHKSEEYRERTGALLVHGYDYGVIRKEKFVVSTDEPGTIE